MDVTNDTIASLKNTLQNKKKLLTEQGYSIDDLKRKVYESSIGKKTNKIKKGKNEQEGK